MNVVQGVGWGSLLSYTTLLTFGVLGTGETPVDISQETKAEDKSGKGTIGDHQLDSETSS